MIPKLKFPHEAALTSDLSLLSPVLRGLRICFIAGTLGQGGAERQLFFALKCLRDSGAQVSLLCLTKGEFWEEPIADLGIPIHHVGENRFRPARLLRVLRLVHRLHPHVVQAQHFYTGVYAGLSGRLLGIPSIGSVRSDALWEFKTNGSLISNLSLSLPHCITANSMCALQNIRTAYKIKHLYYLRNVVDTDAFVPRANRTQTETFTVLGIGSLEPAKRFDRFFLILQQVRNRIARRLRVFLAGDGRLRKEIDSLAQDSRKNGMQVELLGRVADPRQLFQLADAVLLTSDREGTPNVLMEAMACELPIIASAVGGVPELLQDGQTGFLFAPNDTSRAVEQVIQIASDQSLSGRLALEAGRYIKANHSYALLPKILHDLYAALLTNGPV